MPKPKSKRSHPICVYDVGSAFTKVGDFEVTAGAARQIAWQYFPSGMGYQTLPERPSHLTTSRLATLRVLVAGFVNEPIDESLLFCQQLGIHVAGVLSQKQLVWEGDSEETLSPFDAVLLMGGFERRTQKLLTTVVTRLRSVLKENGGAVTIFYLGSEEMRSVVESILEQSWPLYLIPDAWPGRTHRDFLRLFVELQALQLQKSVVQDPVLADYAKLGVPMVSGHAALLSSLSLLTNTFSANTLLIDIGSDKTTVCWSYFSDAFTIPNWNPSVQTSMFSGSGGDREHRHFGLKIYAHYGLGGSVDEAFAELSLDESALHWPTEGGQLVRDRVLNHALYPATLPDSSDLTWQSALVQYFLTRIWGDLPADYRPSHIVFSGAYFGAGERLTDFVDLALFPSRLSLSATLWCNREPTLPSLGLLAAQTERIDTASTLLKLGEYVLLSGKPDRRGILSQVEVSGAGGVVKKFEVKRGERHVLAVSAKQPATVRFLPAAKAQIVGHKRGQMVEIDVQEPLEKGIMIDGRIGP